MLYLDTKGYRNTVPTRSALAIVEYAVESNISLPAFAEGAEEGVRTIHCIVLCCIFTVTIYVLCIHCFNCIPVAILKFKEDGAFTMSVICLDDINIKTANRTIRRPVISSR